MRGLNVAVAGCGPCGLAVALLLARQGHQVTVFERFDAPQPIGSGLMIQPTGLAVLREIGLDQQVLAEGQTIERLFGTASGRVVLDVRYQALGRPDQFGIGVHRSSLFNALHDAVRSVGVEVRGNHTIEGSELDGSRRRLRFENETTSDPFDLVVDTLGTRTQLGEGSGFDLPYGALWATLDWVDGFDLTALQQRYRQCSVMAGVLPIGEGANGRARVAFFWSLRRDLLEHWRDGGLAPWKSDVEELWPACAALTEQIHAPDQLTFARYSHRTLKRPLEKALIHLGDAWHSASPQLGQGANMALLDAWALALALDRSSNLDQALELSISLRRRHVVLYQWLTALFTPVYQSDSNVLPFLRDRLVGPISKLWPATWIQAAMVSGLIGNPLRRLDLSLERK